MFNWSNFQILRLLQQQPNRLKNFLLEVPLNDLQAAVEEKQLSADLQFRQSREQFAYKKNILDMNLDELINLCYQQKIINFFQKKLALDQTRIQNHPQYGHRLINQCPEKYYLGERSRHYNRARQIEEAYGIFRSHDHEDSSNEDANGSESRPDHQQNDLSEQSGQNHEHDSNQQAPNDQDNGDQLSINEDSQDNFIDQDQDIEEDLLSEDSVEEKIRNRKNKKKLEKLSSPQKVERSQRKSEISQKTTERKLKKPTMETNPQINFEEYLIKAQQVNLTQQTERSKRNQKKLKQQLKRLQSSLSTQPSNLSTHLPQTFQEPLVATRKIGKMNVLLD